MAQTKVVKKNAVKANNFGISYSLPKTSLVVEAEVTKVTCKVGPYYKYAEKYLGVKDVITADKVYYELGKVSLINKGVPVSEINPASNVAQSYKELAIYVSDSIHRHELIKKYSNNSKGSIDSILKG